MREREERHVLLEIIKALIYGNFTIIGNEGMEKRYIAAASFVCT